MSKQSLSEAVNLAGGQNALAVGIKARFPDSKVSQAHVWKWLNRSACEVPPAEYVIAIAEIVNWQMTPHQLRPDIYPNTLDALPEGERPRLIAMESEPPSVPTSIECASGDPRRGIDRRGREKRQRIERRKDGA